MKILITGGAGFIGSNLALRAIQKGWQVRILDSFVPYSGANRANLHPFERDIDLLEGSILDEKMLTQATQGVDCVVHCAAATSHSRSIREPLGDLEANVTGTLRLLMHLQKTNNNSRFIYIGTSTQIGPLLSAEADETHPEHPADLYSAHKSFGEKHAFLYHRLYGIPVTSLRLSNVYGPRAAIHTPELTFNNYFIGLALLDREITVYGEGSQKRNLVYVDDCVDAILAAIPSKEAVGQIFQISGNKHLSVMDIAHEICRVFGKGKVRQIPWPSERKSLEFGDAILSNAKAKKILGWKPKTDWEAGLRLTQSYYLERLDDYLSKKFAIAQN